MLADMIQRLGKGPFYSYGAALAGTGAVGLNLLSICSLSCRWISREPGDREEEEQIPLVQNMEAEEIRVKLRSDVCTEAKGGLSEVCSFLTAAFLESCWTVMRLLCSLPWRLQVCGPKGQCESPLALLWGPRIPFPEDGLLRLFYFFGSGSELAPASLAAQEGRSPFAQPLLESLESGTSLSLCVTPRCPTPVGQDSARTLRCSAKGLFSLLFSPQHVLWLFDQDQRCREGGAMGQEMLKILLLQCRLELWAPQAGGGREQHHL